MEPEDNGTPIAGPSNIPEETRPSEASPGATPLAQKSVLSTVKPEFIASFLSLDVSFVTNLPSAVIQKISARANEFEALKSQRLLDEVSYGMLNYVYSAL
jgi:hypothetical protein